MIRAGIGGVGTYGVNVEKHGIFPGRYYQEAISYLTVLSGEAQTGSEMLLDVAALSGS